MDRDTDVILVIETLVIKITKISLKMIQKLFVPKMMKLIAMFWKNLVK